MSPFEPVAPAAETHPTPAPSRAEVLDSYVGSALYDVVPDHRPAVLLVAAAVAAFWLARRHRPQLLAAYDRLDPLLRILAWVLAISTAVHLGVGLGHELAPFSLVYLGGALLPAMALRTLLRGKPWRRVTRSALLMLTLGYAGLAMVEPPDSLGLTTKLVELTGLAIALRPARPVRRRMIGAAAATVAVAIVTATGGWVGAMSAGDGGHHLGDIPPPGFLLPPGEDRPPTPAEAEAAQALHDQTAAAVARFSDISTAAAAGYAVAGIAGTDFHADNPELKNDGRILDPDHPETLIYAVGASGSPVLLGVMYQMDRIGEPGPTVGGPLTVWHAHAQVCVSVLPFGLSGLASPFGLCPLGSVTLPVTNEMLHVWTAPGVAPEDWFGDVEGAWLAEYLAAR